MYKEIIQELGIDRYRELFRTVYAMDAVEIISMYEPLEETKTQGKYSCSCPFHSESSKGAFSVKRSYEGNATGGYYCFGCGAKGNGITYVKEKFFGGDEGDSREVVLKIAQDKGLLTLKDNLLITTSYQKKERSPSPELTPAKSIEERDFIYNLFLSCCPLKKEDRQYLKTHRGLTDEQIDKKGYRSAPNRSILFSEKDNRITEGFSSFTQALAMQKIKKEDVLGVPGFYLEKKRIKNEEKELLTFSKATGILIPCKDANGLIQAIQIDPKAKLKEHWKGPKYYWWSSAHADKLTNSKLSKGCSAGAPIGVVYPKKLKTSCIFITEGDYKAESIARYFGGIAISLQGVGNWKGITETLYGVQNSSEYQSFSDKKKDLIVAFDGDMVYNYAVFSQLKKMTDHIHCMYDFKLYYLCWHIKYGKGIDDVLMSYPNYVDVLKKIKKQKWDSFYSQTVSRILEKSNYSKLLEIPAEIFREEIKKELSQNLVENNHSSK